MGKGLLGLLTKPTGGAVDMVSMAFDGIRRYSIHVSLVSDLASAYS